MHISMRAFAKQCGLKCSLQVSLVLASALVLSACGFTLRGSQALPSSVNHVVLISDFAYAPLERALSKRLPVYQLSAIVGQKNVPDDLALSAQVLLNLKPEQLERRLLSVFSSGQVAEYELIYVVDYSVKFPFTDALPASVSVTREYQDDPDEVLAKSRELELVLHEMRAEAADRMIRLLSSQYSSALLHANTDKKSTQ